MSDSEQEVLHALWMHGPRIVREIQAFLADAGHDWSRSTVITLLQRLERKGYVASDKSGHAFVFRPAVTREDLGRQRLREVADELFEGDPAPLLLAFAKKHRFSDEELQQFREMIREAEKRRRKN